MARVIVTGAAGTIGRLLCPALRGDGHEVLGLDVAEGEGVHRADLSAWDPALPDLFRGADALAHLAAEAWPEAPWSRVAPLNLDMALNAFQAASLAGVPRVVFASTNWVLAGHRFDGEPLRSDTVPAPMNPYGASKLFGERLGLSFAEARGLSVVCLRIGAAQPEPRAPGPDTPMGDWARQMWLSPRDLLQGFRRALAAPLALRFAVLNLVSNNPGMRWDLQEARDAIGYVPEDSFEPPPGGFRRTEATARAVWEARERLDRLFHDEEM